jgi:membrane-associated protease RseP (regulator of RpoE activity)
MDTLAYLLGIFAAVLGIAVSIGLHEVGHMVPAKRFGVRVPQYMIGFGPTLWSRKRGETEYGIKAIPLGGYVRMIGMYPPPRTAVPGGDRAAPPGRLASLAEAAKEAAWEDIRPGDDNRVFYKLPPHRKIIVMLGGPVTNLVIAFVLFTVLLVGMGIPGPTTEIAKVSGCIPASMVSEQAARQALADPSAFPEGCAAADPRSPAAAAGMRPGDVLTAIDGTEVTQWSDLTAITRASPGRTVTISYTRDGVAGEAQVTVATAYRPVLDETGSYTGQVAATGFLGITPDVAAQSQPLTAVPTTMWDMTTRSAAALVALPGKVIDLAGTMISGGTRDPEGPVSVIGIGRMSGEVASAHDPLRERVATLISLAASLNLFLFLFNMLPLLPLDGGHVVGAVWEAVRRRVARWRGQPEPGPVDVSKAMPLAYAVSILLIALSSVVILADVIKPLSITGG